MLMISLRIYNLSRLIFTKRQWGNFNEQFSIGFLK